MSMQFRKSCLFSAIFLQSLAMRPVHEYNMSMGGNTPQVPVLSKLAMSDQRHDGITPWHSSQLQELVPVREWRFESSLRHFLNNIAFFLARTGQTIRAAIRYAVVAQKQNAAQAGADVRIRSCRTHREQNRRRLPAPVVQRSPRSPVNRSRPAARSPRLVQPNQARCGQVRADSGGSSDLDLQRLSA